jgi:hypothetical protein
LAEQIARESQPVPVHQEVRLRVFRAQRVNRQAAKPRDVCLTAWACRAAETCSCKGTSNSDALAASPLREEGAHARRRRPPRRFSETGSSRVAPSRPEAGREGITAARTKPEPCGGVALVAMRLLLSIRPERMQESVAHGPRAASRCRAGQVPL